MSRQPLSPVAIAAVLVAVLGGALFLYLRARQSSEVEPAGSGAVSSSAIEAPAPAPSPEKLPELAESDETFRALAARLSEHPALVAWLTPDRLIERFVTAVDNVARGESPRPHLRHLEPEGGFAVVESEGIVRVDARSHARYDAFAEVFTSLDTAAAVRLYRRFEPLFEEAYRDLGYPEGEFDRVLARAIDELLATPVPRGEVEVEREVTTYRYHDPELESLSAAQKHFLRMGPSNMRRLQAKLRVVRAALGLPRGS